MSDAGSIGIAGVDGGSAGAVLNRSGEIRTESATGDIAIQAASLTNDTATPVQVTGTHVLWSHTYDDGSTTTIPVPVGLLDGTTGEQGTGYLLAYGNVQESSHHKGDPTDAQVYVEVDGNLR